jgi:arginyl-tRNA synthetase
MKERLEELLQHAIARASKGGALKTRSLPPLIFEVPRDPQFGDLASTVALTLAREERQPPRRIAEVILAHLEDPEGILSNTEVAGPGYLNFRFSPRFWQSRLADLERQDYGLANIGQGRRVLIEFVSANPTGPLHVGHGRGAVIGDVVARLLSASGHAVTREYYVNDAGRQIATLGRSAFIRLLEAYGHEEPLPEDGYPGEYLSELMTGQRESAVREIAAAIGCAPPASAIADFLLQNRETAEPVLARFAADRLLEVIRSDLRSIRVDFDVFSSETALRTDGLVGAALDELDRRGLLYESEGARWFRTSQFGDEKDRVVARSNGELTYFAADIGYHREKIARGYDELIDVWGADHHGHIKRVEAAIEALGSDPKLLNVILVQLVRLTRGGEPVRMGKRSGEFVTMREVVDEVGADATRFFFLMRKADSHLDFDLDLAKKQSSENPVFYVQYAHARICSLFRQAEAEGLGVPSAAEVDATLIGGPEEQELLTSLVRFPDTVEEAVREREPHRIVFHLIDMAGSFHRFYNRHRVVGAEPAVARARLYLAAATRRVLATGLGLLGVRAPESM